MLAYAQMRGQGLARTGEIVSALRLTRLQERELFRRMARGRMIARVRPGLYLVPPRLPLGGSWSPDETLALDALIADRRGRYQICGPSAFSPERVWPTRPLCSLPHGGGGLSRHAVCGYEPGLITQMPVRP